MSLKIPLKHFYQLVHNSVKKLYETLTKEGRIGKPRKYEYISNTLVRSSRHLPAQS